MGRSPRSFTEVRQGDFEHMPAKVQEERIISPCSHSRPVPRPSSCVAPQIPKPCRWPEIWCERYQSDTATGANKPQEAHEPIGQLNGTRVLVKCRIAGIGAWKGKAGEHNTRSVGTLTKHLAAFLALCRRASSALTLRSSVRAWP